MTDIEHPPFTIAIDNAPGFSLVKDIAVTIRGPFGSIQVSIDLLGNYNFHHDRVPGMNEVPLITIASGNLYPDD